MQMIRALIIFLFLTLTACSTVRDDDGMPERADVTVNGATRSVKFARGEWERGFLVHTGNYYISPCPKYAACFARNPVAVGNHDTLEVSVPYRVAPDSMSYEIFIPATETDYTLLTTGNGRMPLTIPLPEAAGIYVVNVRAGWRCCGGFEYEFAVQVTP